MNNALMGNLDGNIERIAFDLKNVKQILGRSKANVVFSEDDPGLFLEMDDRVYPVSGDIQKGDIKPYFIVHKSGKAFNVKDYEILFHVKLLPNDLISGVNAEGERHLCTRCEADLAPGENEEQLTLDEIDEKMKATFNSLEELKDLKEMIHKLKTGQFFESLTMEFSGKIKEIAQELIDFRKDIQNRLQPDIVEIAARDIPEASYQLEGINQTLESCTMKIMDINEEMMEVANGQLDALKSYISGNGDGNRAPGGEVVIIEQEMDCLRRLGDLSLSMMEPLSFQDLVGQRIQRIIRLVKSMEIRIEDLIISFGIKIQKHKEDPNRSFEDLKQEVEHYKSELKGPQNDGEGLCQSDIDDLLASL